MSEKRYIEVELAGQTRLLKFDYNAICDIEEKYGKGVAALFSESAAGLSTIRVLYWGALKWKDKGVTLERVGQMLAAELDAGRTVEDLTRDIMRCLKASRVLGSQSAAEDEAPSEGNG